MSREPVTSKAGNIESEGQIVIPLKGDNQGSIALAHNPVFYSRTKHIDIQHHYIRDEVASQKSNCPTTQHRGWLPTALQRLWLTSSSTVSSSRWIWPRAQYQHSHSHRSHTHQNRQPPLSATKANLSPILKQGQFVQKRNKNAFRNRRLVQPMPYFWLAYIIIR